MQVKYKSVDVNGALQIYFRTCWADKKGTHLRPVDKREVDLFCVFCPETDECYYFDPSQFRKSVTLRVRPPKNRQKMFVKEVSEFRRIP